MNLTDVRKTGLLVLCLMLLGCPDSKGDPTDAEVLPATPGDLDASSRQPTTFRDRGLIGPEGGTVMNDFISIYVPAMALGAPTLIGIDPLPAPPPGAIGPAWEIGPSGTTFRVPAVITMRPPLELLDGHAPAELVLSTHAEGQWQTLGDARLLQTSTFLGATTHLSPFALVLRSMSKSDDGNDCVADACPNGTCLDGYRDFSCKCNPGFTYDPLAKRCDKQTICRPEACANGSCVEQGEDYVCACNPGFQYDAAAKTCVNIDDCMPGACPNGTCMDGIQGFTCNCSPGYRHDTDAHACVEINDCPEGACANGSCVDGTSDYSCVCNPGFAYDPAQKRCDNIPDCMPGLCEHGSCVDGINTYTCSCDPGYMGTGTRSCLGIDDCPSGACANGTCIDGNGTYSCRCNPGFDGTGTQSCTQHNDCPPGACANGTCRDGIGTWDCLCNDGFDGTGTQSCMQRTRCPPGACANGTCVDVPNDYTCSCAPGYLLSGTHACVDADECATKDFCGEGGACANLPGSFRCSCGPNAVLGANGRCSCAANYGDCDGNPGNGCERPLDSAYICGGCWNCYVQVDPSAVMSFPIGVRQTHACTGPAARHNSGLWCGGWTGFACRYDRGAYTCLQERLTTSQCAPGGTCTTLDGGV